MTTKPNVGNKNAIRYIITLSAGILSFGCLLVGTVGTAVTVVRLIVINDSLLGIFGTIGLALGLALSWAFDTLMKRRGKDVS